MVEVRQTKEFSAWLHRLRDANAVVARIRRMEQGNPGDARSVGNGMMEMYRLWPRLPHLLFASRIVILLCGGDKRTQQQDIERAKILAEAP